MKRLAFAAAAALALVTAPPQDTANSSVKISSPGPGSVRTWPKTSSRKTEPNEIMSNRAVLPRLSRSIVQHSASQHSASRQCEFHNPIPYGAPPRDVAPWPGQAVGLHIARGAPARTLMSGYISATSLVTV